MQPNSSIPDIGLHGRGFYSSRSFHPGGSMHAMLDGSVQFISNTTDLANYRALFSRNGGEVTQVELGQ
jgi:hypothetical protein